MENTATARAAAATPAAATPTAPDRPLAELLELASLAPSSAKIQEHRRARFSKEALDELTATVKSLGVVQPIVARPHPKPRGAIRFEIVAGERRYLASKAAGLSTIPGVVRELTDDQALEVQLIENLRREGLDPLDEAIGYEELMRAVKAGGVPKQSADDIAAKIGKSRSYVYQRLKLLALCEDARTAYFDGILGPSTAVYVARIPSADLQKKCVGELRARMRGNFHMSAREIERFVQDNYMLRLAEASFPTADAALLPKAGACGACPKRTGNNRDLFGDVKSVDVCTDPACFQAKQRAHGERELERAKAQGRNVIAGAEARKVAPHGADEYLQGFKRITDEHWSGSTHVKKIASIVPKEDVMLLQDPKSGTAVEVVSNDALQKALVAKGIHRTNTREGSAGNAAQREGERKAKLESEIRRATLAAIHKQHPGKLEREDLELVALAFWRRTHSDMQGRLLAAWEIEPAKSRYGRGFEEAGEKHIKTLSAAELARALLDMALIADTHAVYHYGAGMHKQPEAAILATAKRAGVNAAKIRRDMEAEAKAKQAAKRGQAKKKAAAPAQAKRAKASSSSKKPAKKAAKK